MPPSRPSGSARGPRRTQARPPRRSLVLTAVWAGVASALAACVVTIAAVTVLWLPASGDSGGAGSAIRAGILTFLAGVHGGVTVDGVAADFVPLGLTVMVVASVWRAATAVATCASELDERRPGRLLQAIGAQGLAFALTCTILAAASGLGTSSASVPGAFGLGLLITLFCAGTAMFRHTALADDLRDVELPWLVPGLRATGAALGVYLGVGALLVAGSLALHHDRVMTLSHQVGGGWSSIPVLALGVLAVPNAAIAGAGYLSGAGFAVGSATTVSLTGSTSGLVPAFPILGALPDGHGGSLIGWVLAVLTPLGAGAAVAVIAGRAPTWRERWTNTAAATGVTVVVAMVLAWQGGGAIGDGRLSAVGTSPWQFALLAALWTTTGAALLLALRAAVESLRGARPTHASGVRAAVSLVRGERASIEPDPDSETEPERRDHLAG